MIRFRSNTLRCHPGPCARGPGLGKLYSGELGGGGGRAAHTAAAGVRGTLDPGAKRRDDTWGGLR